MNLLHIAIARHQPSLEQALSAFGNVRTIYWREVDNLQAEIKAALLDFTPDITWMQVQAHNVIDAATVRSIPGKVYNFTGDVRSPLPEWYKSVGRYCTTVFTNMNDVKHMRTLGYDALHTYMGFEEAIQPHSVPQKFDVAFLGSNYENRFPLSAYRKNVITHLMNNYNLLLMGSKWANGVSSNYYDYKDIGLCYSRSKVGINISQFNYEGYTSARMLQIMAAGCFCLTQHYPKIERDFVIGEHLDVFKDIADLDKKLQFYLNNDEERNRIAAQGYEHVKNNYNWTAILKGIIK